MVAEYLQSIQVLLIDGLEEGTLIPMLHFHVEYFGSFPHEEFTEVIIAVVDGLTQCRLPISGHTINACASVNEHLGNALIIV